MLTNKLRNNLTSKPIKFSNLLALSEHPLLVLPRLFKEELNKSKFHGKNKGNSSQNHFERKGEHSYAQASLGSIKEILKIKKNFSQVLFKKIKDIHKTINNLAKPKPYINMMTKSLSQK